MTKHDIITVYGTDSYKMTKRLLEEVNFETLLSNKNASIALKPNIVIAETPESGATTHPEIAIAIIEFLQQKGYWNIFIVESAWIGDSTKKGFEVNGYYHIRDTYNVPLIDVKDDEYVIHTIDGIEMEISKTIVEIDFLINLPVLKGHCQTSITCALKNMKGCISDRSKRYFHTKGLHHPIAALNKVRSSDLVIVDSINGDLDFEEGGNPVQTNRMFIALDSVLIDSYSATLMGYEIEDIPYIKIAKEMGIGSTDLTLASITHLNNPRDEIMEKPTGKVSYLSRYIEADSACSACYASLIHALKRLDEKGVLEQLDKPICIGQGYKGVKDSHRIGVGVCTHNVGKSLTGCPPKALDMLHFLKLHNLK